MGRTNAAVFPDPVLANANICEDVLESKKGMTFFCTGDGVLNPRDLHVCRRDGIKPRSEKSVMTAAGLTDEDVDVNANGNSGGFEFGVSVSSSAFLFALGTARFLPNKVDIY